MIAGIVRADGDEDRVDSHVVAVFGLECYGVGDGFGFSGVEGDDFAGFHGADAELIEDLAGPIGGDGSGKGEVRGAGTGVVGSGLEGDGGDVGGWFGGSRLGWEGVGDTASGRGENRSGRLGEA